MRRSDENGSPPGPAGRPRTLDPLESLMAVGAEPGDTALWGELLATVPGGKRVRPRVLLATYDSLAGSAGACGAVAERTVAERVAAAVELLHTALLAHDDVIDGDLVRHGRPNVAGRYETAARGAGADDVTAQGYGAAAGILAGDLALAGAFRLVATSGAAPDVVAELLGLLDETLHLSADGELTDVWPGSRPSARLDDVLRTAERKTAVYTFGLPLRAAAVLAGRRDLDGPLTELARHLGLAFQLRDDLDGTFGDPATTGKSATSDLRAGRYTALMVLARGTDAWPQIDGVLGDPDATDEDHDQVRRLLERCGARSGVEHLAALHEEQAAALAAELGLTATTDVLAALRTPPAAAA